MVDYPIKEAAGERRERPLRVMFLTQWFEPEPVRKGSLFVKALIDAGHEVAVVTGFPNYPTGKLYPGYRLSLFQKEVINGVAITRVPLYPNHDQSSLRRIANYVSFFLSTLIYGLFFAGRYDVIYVMHPPITTAVSAALFGWVRRKPFIVDVLDLWPDSVAVSGMSGTRTLAAAVGLLCNFVYRRAAAIVVPSAGIRETLIARDVPQRKVTTIFNWADEDMARPLGRRDASQFLSPDRFNIVFAGNIGRMQALDKVVEAALKVMERAPQIKLTFIGNGVDRDSLAELVTRVGAHNVAVFPGVPITDIGDILASADALLVHLANNPLFEITIPSKTQFYLAIGKPILIGVKGEATALVTSAGAGLAAVPEDIDSLAETMIDFSRLPPESLRDMGEKGKSFYLNSMSSRAAFAATDRLLRTVTAQINTRQA